MIVLRCRPPAGRLGARRGAPAPTAGRPPARALARALPEGDGWAYEPKWDGFRAIAFVDGDEVTLQSRNGRELTRYFPELQFPPGRYVIDGEIIVEDDEGQPDFDALGQRIHPAESRIRKLADETPAKFVAFDLLARADELTLEEPYATAASAWSCWSPARSS